MTLPVLIGQARLQIPVRAKAPEEEVLRALEVRQVLAMAMMVGAARVRNFLTETLGVALREGEE